MLVVASAVEPRSAEKWLKQSSRVERRRDFVMAVSSSFQKLLLLIRRVRRLSGVALSGFPAAEPLLGPIFHHIRAGRRARNSRRGSPAGLLCPWETPKTRLRSPCENLAQLAKQPIDGVLALRAAQRRRLCPPRYLLSSEADLWSCRTSYSLVLLGVVHLLEPRRRHGDSSGQSRAGRDHNLQMRQARDVRSRALRLPIGVRQVRDEACVRRQVQALQGVVRRPATHLWRRTVARAITAGGFSRVLCVSVRVRP